MYSQTFDLVQTDCIKTLNLNVEDYRHRVTGARHLHLACEDDHNVFMVAFMTQPQDSTGVAHILEHTSLCGSKKYPVRDPFFMMTRRSLSSFMNAFTSSDWTAYPFASQNEKDFDNLLQVYLDAAFFPKLNRLDFLQEGHRVEFTQADNPNTPLVFKGVVFNEMKGAMSSPDSVLSDALQSALFPTTTYHHNSGGDPQCIPDLTWEQLKAFHAQHYHPSNATFLTYGHINAADHQQKFERWALNYFPRKSQRLMVDAEIRLSEPIQAKTHYAAGDEVQPSDSSHIVMAWLLGDTSDLNALMDAHLLCGVLLNNSASPLQKALETTNLAASPSQLCGLDDHAREFTFCAGVEGAKAEDADRIEHLIMQVLTDVAEKGVPQEQLESVLHQLEISQREVGGQGFPFGLKLMLNILPAALHGGHPAAMLDLDPVLERLRCAIQDRQFIPNLTRRYLLDNPHRVRLLMSPDANLNQKKLEAERQRLAQIAAQLNDQQKQEIIENTHQLKARQEQQDDPDLLPKVTLADIHDDIRVVEGEKVQADDLPIACYAVASNGLIYAHLVIQVPQMSQELKTVFPLFCECLTEVGVGKKDYLQTAAWHDALTGGISARHLIHSDLDDINKAGVGLVLSGKALNRNLKGLAAVLVSTLDEARFSELGRLRELVAQIRTRQEQAITHHGHSLAMIAASATLSPYAALSHDWDGLESIRYIKQLDERLHSDDALQSFANQLEQIRQLLSQASRELLLVGENQLLADCQAVFIDQLNQRANLAVDLTRDPFALTVERQVIKQGWLSNTQVNFCAHAYPVVPANHQDAAALTVLGGYLRNNFLHTAIREQGGAYGGGASYSSNAGAFRFYSYRDPRLAKTLQDYEAALQWLLNKQPVHSARLLEEAILGVIGSLDRPHTPVGGAIEAFYAIRHGYTPAQRRQHRQRVLAVTLDDLCRVANQYLLKDTQHVAVITDQGKIADVQSLGLSAVPI